jgi:hypothetical protein
MIETAVFAALMAGVFAVPGLGVIGALRLVASTAREVRLDAAGVAEKHQLAVVASGLEGVLDEVPVTLAREVWNHAGQSNLPMIVVRAMIVPELDLGLHVRAETMGDAFLDWVASASKTDVETGDPSFDVPFRVAAYEGERARALLDAEIRAAALRLPADGFFEVDDRLVRLAVPYELDGERASWAIETAAWFARSLGEVSSPGASAPTLKPHLPAYREAAEVLGLEFSETPAALRGSLEGVEVCVQLAARARPRRCPSSGHRSRSRSGSDSTFAPSAGTERALRGSETSSSVTDSFDAAFVVRGNDAVFGAQAARRADPEGALRAT